jgi:3-oxoacyl-[acyl-carrier protein] reductase
MKRKTVCITGASRGIGKAAALKFAREGFDIAICCAREEDALLATKKEAESFGISCFSSLCNAGNPEDCARFLSGVRASLGIPDILINNAGISKIGLVQDLTPQEWDAMIRTDLSSVFYMSRILIPPMVQRHSGKIINISSVWGCVGASCEAAYSACKGGVNAFTKALAKELAPSGIQVNAVAFGAIDTSMNASLSSAERAALCEEIPAGRYGTPEEAADFIFSVAASGNYLTGQIIGFDGGWQY